MTTREGTDYKNQKPRGKTAKRADSVIKKFGRLAAKMLLVESLVLVPALGCKTSASDSSNKKPTSAVNIKNDKDGNERDKKEKKTGKDRTGETKEEAGPEKDDVDEEGGSDMGNQKLAPAEKKEVISSEVAIVAHDAAHGIIDYMNTGSEAHLKKITALMSKKKEGKPIADEETFKVGFRKILEDKAGEDKVLSAFLDAYLKSVGAEKINDIDLTDFVSVVTDLYGQKSVEEAQKRHGEEIVEAFTVFASKKLAGHTANLFMTMFDTEKLKASMTRPENAKKVIDELDRITRLTLFGRPLKNYSVYVGTFMSLYKNKVETIEGYSDLYDAYVKYWKASGKPGTAKFFGLPEAVYGCLVLGSNEGRVKAWDIYGKKFVSSLEKMAGINFPIGKAVPEPVKGEEIKKEKEKGKKTEEVEEKPPEEKKPEVEGWGAEVGFKTFDQWEKEKMAEEKEKAEKRAAEKKKKKEKK